MISDHEVTESSPLLRDIDPEATTSSKKTGWRQELAIISRYSAPLMVALLLQHALTGSSIFMVGHLGKKEIGAVSLANMTAQITGYFVFQGLATCLDTLCPQAHGSGRLALVGLHVQRLTLFMLILTIPIGVIWYNADRIFLLLLPSESRETALLAGLYLKIAIAGAPGYACFESGKRFFQAQGLFGVSLVVLVICSTLNIFMGWLFVWKLQWGFIGAPIAVAIANTLLPVLLALHVIFISGSECWHPISAEMWRGWGPMLRLAIPSCLMVEAEVLAWEAMTIISSRLGATELAAQAAMSTLADFAFQISFSIAVAGGTHIAYLLGAGFLQRAATATRVMLLGALGVGLTNMLVIISLRGVIPGLFSDIGEVWHLIFVLLPLNAIIQIPDALATSLNSLLRAVGRPDIGSYVQLSIYYLVGLPLGIALAFGLDWSIFGLWCGILSGQSIIVMLEGFYFWKMTRWITQNSTMDAAEDRDVKLQRASGDLVTEFSAKLPLLLWRSQNGTPLRTPRKWAQVTKTEKLVSLLEPFQEWPQLLDPHLQKVLPPLVDAFLAYLVQHRTQYGSVPPKSSQRGNVYSLPRAICRLLYTFCKVRGVKVISRFLNNEPKYLDSMLRASIEWDADRPSNNGDLIESQHQGLTWEERYVMLVWLSHLLLAPFDLSSLSSDNIPVPYDNLQQLAWLSPDTPMLARSMLSLSLHYVSAPGKEREAATALLARLALRGDMQALGMLTGLVKWAFATIQPAENIEPPSVYACIGVLTFIARLSASGQVEDFAPSISYVLQETLKVYGGQSPVSATIQSSASARKTVIKILRNITGMSLSVNERGDGRITDDQLSTILEDAIDHFLVSLADKDTPVRFAASKALSIITLKLHREMATEVIEAVIGSLEENILFEKEDGSLITPFQARKIGTHTLKRNLSAVDAQRWQGLILTLSHLLFRRAPPISQLHEILQSLVSGLGFEQRSSTGSSVGTGVRDAACFGIWAMSRKYTTPELLALQPQVIASPTGQRELDVLQKLAVELVCAACVDPSGNIRRGSSAALQELIGRHPDTIAQGIPLVQVVDYHAVARRSRALIDVAKATASLDQIYWSPLLSALMGWRGIGSLDAESRRHAAKSIATLSTQESFKTMKLVLDLLLRMFSSISRNDVESRHGCLLSIAATVDAFTLQWEESVETRDTPEAKAVFSQVTSAWEIFGSPSAPTDDDLTFQTSRPELTAEASSCLISSLCRSTLTTGLSQPAEAILDRALHILSLCVSRSDDISIETSSNALSQLFPLLSSSKQEETVRIWFSHLHASRRLPTGRGQILALGTVFERVRAQSDLQDDIVTELLRHTEKEELIEKRVAAVKCLATDVLPYMATTDKVASNFLDFLNDYTTDRRGDIGSLIRVEAIQAVGILLQREASSTPRSPLVQELIGCLCRLACEKLDKVRLQAWASLQSFWETASDLPPLERKFEHFTHVSSQEYFAQLLTLQNIDWLRLPLLQGLATSAISGAEGLVRACRSALTQFLNSLDQSRRQEILIVFLQDLATILGDNLQDDRFAIPAMEFVAFIIDSYIAVIPEGSDASFRKLFVLVQKAHFRSSNIARLEAAVKVYAALARIDTLREGVLKKLTGLLLHPFPRIRSSAAEYLFVLTGSEIAKYEDWSAPAKQLKPQVDSIKTTLSLES
ncbi:Tubulin-specific chaperone D [Penicillium sp. DV-2018c]|nr:Tubulin-specific chaperone D [Penicillium sp. DV-2018c]